jgi:hypothetical protein
MQSQPPPPRNRAAVVAAYADFVAAVRSGSWIDGADAEQMLTDGQSVVNTDFAEAGAPHGFCDHIHSTMESVYGYAKHLGYLRAHATTPEEAASLHTATEAAFAWGWWLFEEYHHCTTYHSGIDPPAKIEIA